MKKIKSLKKKKNVNLKKYFVNSPQVWLVLSESYWLIHPSRTLETICKREHDKPREHEYDIDRYIDTVVHLWWMNEESYVDKWFDIMYINSKNREEEIKNIARNLCFFISSIPPRW